MKDLKILIFCLTALSLSACATMGSHKDEDAIKKVKTVAVVAFIEKEPASDMIGFNGNTGGKSVQMGGSSFYQNNKHADDLYKDFAKALAKQTNWSVKPMYDVGNHPLYIDQYKKIMPAIQITQLPPSGENWYMAKEIMLPGGADAIGVDGRNKLASVLGVDAVVVVKIKTEIHGWFLGRIGPRHPQTTVDFKVYARGTPEPIWTEWIEGKKSEESLGWFGFMDEDRISQLSVESMHSAFERIGTDPSAKED